MQHPHFELFVGESCCFRKLYVGYLIQDSTLFYRMETICKIATILTHVTDIFRNNNTQLWKILIIVAKSYNFLQLHAQSFTQNEVEKKAQM